MKVIVACEESQRVSLAFREIGHEAYSCDIKQCSGGHPEYHIQDDCLKVIYRPWWDAMIAHPVCKRLTNTAVRWYHSPPKDKTLEEMWADFCKAVEFYEKIRNAPISKKAIENPVWHIYARQALGFPQRQFVQPHFFGDKAFKNTGFELIGLPRLKRTHWLTLPKKGTDEYKRWSWVHLLPPSPERETLRSKTFPGIARAMAEQWG